MGLGRRFGLRWELESYEESAIDLRLFEWEMGWRLNVDAKLVVMNSETWKSKCGI